MSGSQLRWRSVWHSVDLLGHERLQKEIRGLCEPQNKIVLVQNTSQRGCLISGKIGSGSGSPVTLSLFKVENGHDQAGVKVRATKGACTVPEK